MQFHRLQKPGEKRRIYLMKEGSIVVSSREGAQRLLEMHYSREEQFQRELVTSHFTMV